MRSAAWEAARSHLLDQSQHFVQRGPCGQRACRCCLDDRPVRERIRVRHAKLDDVRASLPRRPARQRQVRNATQRGSIRRASSSARSASAVVARLGSPAQMNGMRAGLGGAACARDLSAHGAARGASACHARARTACAPEQPQRRRSADWLRAQPQRRPRHHATPHACRAHAGAAELQRVAPHGAQRRKTARGAAALLLALERQAQRVRVRSERAAVTRATLHSRTPRALARNRRPVG